MISTSALVSGNALETEGVTASDGLDSIDSCECHLKTPREGGLCSPSMSPEEGSADESVSSTLVGTGGPGSSASDGALV